MVNTLFFVKAQSWVKPRLLKSILVTFTLQLLSLVMLLFTLTKHIERVTPVEILPSQKLRCLSFSIYGNTSIYSIGILKTVRDAISIYHNWSVRIYHDDDISEESKHFFVNMSDVVLIDVNKDLPSWVGEYVNPKAWRFLVADDQNVSYFAIRDADSKPSLREKAAVDEWIESGKHFHTMHDHPLHDPDSAPILAGMWGGIAGTIPNFKLILQNHYRNMNWSKIVPFEYDEDQQFLARYVFPKLNLSCLKHDSYYCSKSGGIGFPTRRNETEEPFDFVGNFFNRISQYNQTSYYEDLRLNNEDFYPMYEQCLEKRKKLFYLIL